jgi:class 3 adenylate cyclase
MNEEAIGLELTTSVDAVAQLVAFERPDVSSDAAVDGLVTVLFSDIESSTEIGEQLGDLAWLRLLSRYDSEVRAAVGRRHGRVVKAMGDGYMAVFSSARDALACALDLQDIALDGVSTRVGVHLGEAIRAADDFFGRAVTVAARIAGSAAGGEVLTSDVVREVVAGFRDVEFVDARLVELKGLGGSQLVHLVRRAAAGG